MTKATAHTNQSGEHTSSAGSVLKLLDELDDEAVDGLVQLGYQYFGALAECMIAINHKLDEQILLPAEVVSDLRDFSDQVLEIWGQSDNRRGAIREVHWLRKTIVVLQRHVRDHDSLPEDWHAIRPEFFRSHLTRRLSSN